MPDNQFEDQWAEWMAIEGLDIEDEVVQEIKDNITKQVSAIEIIFFPLNFNNLNQT